MKRTLLAAVAGLALASVGTRASAEDKPQKGQKGEKTEMKGARVDEPKKHLSEIDVYLHDAKNNVKVIYETTQMTPGKLDATIQRESLNNIERSITGALTHISHIRAMPEARVEEMSRLEALQRDLQQARTMVNQLRTAVRQDNREQTAALASQLFAQFKGAEENFAQIAERQGLTRVDKIDVPERQPVGGREGPAEGQEPRPGMEEQPGQPMPGQQPGQPSRGY